MLLTQCGRVRLGNMVDPKYTLGASISKSLLRLTVRRPAMTSATTYKAATIQFEPTMFEKERNISRLLELVRTSRDIGGAPDRHARDGDHGVLLVRSGRGQALCRDGAGTNHRSL